ncbi:jg11455 [Pararge aegeria aegeria]|uniref:Jg11455 protein n=1 Tax=Pararge aegeria aegeria TaxID=348720 RepID=A0A8S4RYP7_9NEOP|nr:jg11455 [Pararge aegeria aegeria]
MEYLLYLFVTRDVTVLIFERFKRNAGLLVCLGMGKDARRSKRVVGPRAPHVRPNLGSGDVWSDRVSGGEKKKKKTSEVGKSSSLAKKLCRG